MFKKSLKGAVLATALFLTACADPYGGIDPVGTFALGAATGAVVGFGARTYSSPPGYFVAPAPTWRLHNWSMYPMRPHNFHWHHHPRFNTYRHF